MLIASIIQAATFLLYVGYVAKRFGILSNISKSWEMLSPQENHLFTLFLLGLGIPMFFQSNGTYGFFALSGAGFVFTAFSMKFTFMCKCRAHYSGVAAGILGSLLGLYFENGFWVPTAMLASSMLLIGYSNLSNKIWWIEIAAFVSIIQGLFYR
jgi:hypothetical protein